MSNARKVRLIRTNASTHKLGSLVHRLTRELFRSRLIRCRSWLSAAMSFPHFLGQGFQPHRLAQNRIVPVTLNEIRPTHECAMLRGTSVIMPKIEVREIDWIRKGRSS